MRNDYTRLLLVSLMLVIGELLWYPYYLAFLLFGDSFLARAVGRVLQFLNYLVIFSILVRKIPMEKKERTYSYLDMVEFGFIYLILTFFMSGGEVGTPKGPPEIFLLQVVGAVILAPVVEELFFRWMFVAIVAGANLGTYDRRNKLAVNAAIFSLPHYLYSGNIPWLSVIAWGVYSVCALHVFMETHSLKLVIFLHAFVNFMIYAFLTLALLGVPEKTLQIVIGSMYTFVLITMATRHRELLKTLRPPQHAGAVLLPLALFVLASLVIGFLSFQFVQLTDGRPLPIAFLLYFTIVPLYFLSVVKVSRGRSVQRPRTDLI